ncbi:MAG: NTPase [Candidatus Lokiarchaeota archaeon]|nr:NTPase [Candidatus Lokiarchaeota archaeon]
MKRMKHNILLTGRPGIGKSTAIKKIAERIDTVEIGGFWSQEIKVRGKRVGFSIETLCGKKGVLAHIKFSQGPRVSKYRVNIQDIDTIAVSSMETARVKEAIIVIDEIAKMELYSDKFKHEVLNCLETGRVLATIQKRKHPFLNEIRSRDDVIIIEVTETNRDEIPSKVLSLIGFL